MFRYWLGLTQSLFYLPTLNYPLPSCSSLLSKKKMISSLRIVLFETQLAIHFSSAIQYKLIATLSDFFPKE